MTKHALLKRTLELATTYLDSLPTRHVGATADTESLRKGFAVGLTDNGVDAKTVIEELAEAAEGGLIASAGPRYYGFVIGGAYPVSVAADWLTSAWDQNCGAYSVSPAASVVEEVAADWILELLGLPANASVGFVTGGQMANFTCLAAARYEVLRRAGWDVEAKGLYGAPRINVIVGADAHVTIYIALRYLGIGREQVRVVSVDEQGRMLGDKLPAVLADCDGPTIVCAQAGDVNSGAFDPLEPIVAAAHAHNAWVHVDGAFGLWALASPSLKHLAVGAAGADSWATDAHKWLNVPYDSGLAITTHPAAHRAAFTANAEYLEVSDGSVRDEFDFAPEFSRRGRGFCVYAVLRHLGRKGIAELVEKNTRLAQRIAKRLESADNVTVLNDVVLNQVLVRFTPPRGGDADQFTRDVISRVQNDGTCWLSGTTWHEQAAMRISICGWSTTEVDIDQSADAILKACKG